MPLIKHRTIHRAIPSAEFVDDSELGRVKLISNNGRYLRINIRTNGEIVVSKPTGTSRRQVLAFIEESRPHIRRSLEKLSRQRQFKDGDAVTEEYVKYANQLKELVKRGFSAAVYTQTTDVEGEVNGLMTYDRKVIKINEAKIKAANEAVIKAMEE